MKHTVTQATAEAINNLLKNCSLEDVHVDLFNAAEQIGGHKDAAENCFATYASMNNLKLLMRLVKTLKPVKTAA